MRRSLGSIQNRGKNRWLIQVTLPSIDGKQHRRSKTIRGTKRDAESALNQMLSSVGTYEGESTFAEFAARYIEWHDQIYNRPDAMKRWHRDMDKLVERFGGLKMSQLRRDVMEIWATEKSTTGHEINKMKAALTKAVEWDYISTNPLKAIKPHRAAPKKDRFTLEESVKILDAVKGTDIEAIVLLMLMCGMRREEAMALSWSDIDWKAGTVKIDRSWHYDAGRGWFEDTKNASSRRLVSIDAQTLARLSEIRSQGAVVRLGAICESPRHVGERMAPNTAAKRWREIVKPLLGERYLPMKNLRHTHASLCLDAGVSMEAIAKRLGHASTRLTESVYAESDTLQEQCAVAIGEMFA